jgi:hypothetical protein
MASEDAVDAQLLPGAPVRYQHVAVEQRRSNRSPRDNCTPRGSSPRPSISFPGTAGTARAREVRDKRVSVGEMKDVVGSSEFPPRSTVAIFRETGKAARPNDVVVV